jgi:parallel beta-helix repeat protein
MTTVARSHKAALSRALVGVLAASVSVGAALAQASVEIYPGQDVQAIVAAAPAGARFLLKAGVHRLQSITPQTGQTFVGEAGAVLSGARLLSGFSRAGNAWVVSGQTQQGRVADGECRGAYPGCGYPEDLFIDDVPLQHVTSLRDGGPGRWHFDYAADQIHVWDDPADRIVETSVTPAAFGGDATGVTIRNLTVEKYATPTFTSAIELGRGWTIEDSEVRWNHFGGIGNGPESTARRNRVHHNGCYGFHGSGENILVEGNQISHNGYAGYEPFWGAGGSKWVYTRNLVVRGNVSHHNLGPGLWTDIDNIHTLYENNIVDDNERGGIFHEISYDAIIRHNTLRRNGTGRHFPHWTTGAGIEVVSSRNVQVYGNTLEDNWQGITGLEDHRGAGTHGPWTLRNLDVHDNAVTSRLVDAGAGRTGIVDTAGTGAFSAAANNRYRQNRYAFGPLRQVFMWMGADLTELQWQRIGHDTAGTFQR